VWLSSQDGEAETMELLRVGVAEEDEIFRRGLMAILLDEDWDCIVLATDGEPNGEAADSTANLDIAVVCKGARANAAAVSHRVPGSAALRRGELPFLGQRQGDPAS
jgi:hypothetical protein